MGDLLDTLLLLDVLQGAGLAFVLAARHKDVLANRLLAALMAGVAAMLLLGYCERRWGFHGYPHLLGLASPLPFLFGPLLYLYIVALTRPVATFDRRWLAHALPAVIDAIYMTQLFYLHSGDEKLAIVRAYRSGGSTFSLYVIEGFELVQAVTYLALSWIELRRYGRRMQGYFSDLARIDLRWLRAMVLAHAATWSVVAVSVVLRPFGVQAAVRDSLTRGVHVGSTLAIFLTGYISLWQPELFQKAGAAARAPVASAAKALAKDQRKYQRNRIDEAEAQQLVARLLALMLEQRPYRDSALTLPVLAEALGIPPHSLSQLLNVRLEKTFYAFVNSYRVEAVKQALADPSQNHRGVLEIAYDAGFNSKSTLNSCFKRETGETPTAFRAKAS